MDLREKARERPQDMTDAEWREVLSPKEYHVMREAGTEPPFTGALVAKKGDGTYHCAACHAALFDATVKYESGSGWPSFWKAREDAPVDTREDRSHGMVRTEIRCARCGAHLGHLFEDGPDPTGERYCVNSAALEFEPESSSGND